MLKGFTVPKSPFGQAALTPPPPWHYAGDVVGVEFWTHPDATAATLPHGLSRDPKSNGRAVMMFLDWQFTAQDDEYLDPARYQYREAFILVDAMYGDLPVMWCPYIYVDNDAALACGWTRGFPKKMGSIFQTRSFAASGPAAAPVTSGSRFGASLSAHGQRLAEACVTLHESVENGLSLLSRPTVSLRYFPRLAARYHDKTAGQRAGDVDQGETHCCRCMDRQGRAQFSGNERRRTPHACAEPDRVGVPLLTLLLS